MSQPNQGGSYGQGVNPYYYRQQGQGGQPMMYPYYQNQMAGQQQPMQQQQPSAGQQGQLQVPQFPTQKNPGYTNNIPGMLPEEESYIENILRLNRGKEATVYMTFENNDEWNAKVFNGVIEAAGRDHIILSDPQTGKRYLLLMVYLDYITFPEEITYAYPYGGNTNNMVNYNPR